jgi:hypothetical protein
MEDFRSSAPSGTTRAESIVSSAAGPAGIVSGPDPRRLATKRGEDQVAKKPVHVDKEPGWNDPCPCGSWKGVQEVSRRELIASAAGPTRARADPPSFPLRSLPSLPMTYQTLPRMVAGKPTKSLNV